MLERYIIDIKIFIPELILGSLFLFLLIVGLIIKKNKISILSSIFAFGILCSTYIILKQLPNQKTIFLFSHLLKLNNQGLQIKLLVMFSAIAIAIHVAIKKSIKDYETEFYVLITGILLAGNIVIMANNWLVFFLCLETISIATYCLVALRWSATSAQTSVRYILFGLVCSAVMLYGISLFYGLNGSLYFDEIKTLPHNLPAIPTIIAFVFIASGVFF